MRLQVIRDYRAVKTPCLTCSKFGGESYPSCIDGPCRKVNNYLVAIGDIPHIKPKPTDLAALYPPAKLGTPAKLATPEQTEEACQKVIDLKRSFKIRELAAMTGFSTAYINCLMRREVKRMGLEKYLILEGIKID